MILLALTAALAGAAASSALARSHPSEQVAAIAKKKSLPTPKLSLAVTQAGNEVRIKGAYTLKGKPLPSALKWAEQEFDASGNALPLDASGYKLALDPSTKSWVAHTIATGTSGSVVQRIPGASEMRLAISVSVRATKTHRRASALRRYVFPLPDDGEIAVGTEVPKITMNYTGGGSACDFVDDTLDAPDGQPTASLPTDWVCHNAPSLDQCKPVGLPPGPPQDLIPPVNHGDGVGDGVIQNTGFTDYPIGVQCPDGNLAIAQLRVAIGYTDSGGTPVDSCEIEMPGISSFTAPTTWGGFVGFDALMLSVKPDHSLFFAGDFTNRAYFQKRTSGTDEVCQGPGWHLPQINTSPIVFR